MDNENQNGNLFYKENKSMIKTFVLSNNVCPIICTTGGKGAAPMNYYSNSTGSILTSLYSRQNKQNNSTYAS